MKKIFIILICSFLTINQTRPDHQLSTALSALGGIFLSIPISNQIWSMYARTKTQRLVELQGQASINVLMHPENSELQKIYQKEQLDLFNKLQSFNRRSGYINTLYKKLEINLGISPAFDPGLWNYLFLATGSFILAQFVKAAESLI